MGAVEKNKLAIGEIFGRLTVSGLPRSIKRKKHSHVYYPCNCTCGSHKLVRKDHLIYKKTVSCGCKQKEFFKQQGTGEKAWNWKGGRHINSNGYVGIYMPKHPRSKSNGYITEHTVVMEKEIGRYLLEKETVHHLNGNKEDNRIENLELWSSSHPSGQRVSDKVKWAKEILQVYDNENEKSHRFNWVAKFRKKFLEQGANKK